MKTPAHQLDGWIPIRLYRQDSRPFVDWCYLGDGRLTEPFFDQTIERILRHPFNLLFRRQTPIELLGEQHEHRPGIPPTGFIFHMSRCGSTLVAQSLAALAQNVVVSEAAPLDWVLRANLRDTDVADEQRILWLCWVLSALARKRHEDERRLFVKFDCWSTLDLSLIRRAFPGVPWIFVYRDPVEVLVSQLKRRGAHTLPGVIEPQLFGLDSSSVVAMSGEEYCARVLGAICEAALGQYEGEGGGLLVNYRQLPEATWTSISEFFRTDFDEDERERMRRATRFDAKNPSMTFEADSEAKHMAATRAARDAVERFVRPHFERLEAARLAKMNAL